MLSSFFVMSWWSWLTGAAPADDETWEDAVKDDTPRQLVNLTGVPVHLCRKISGGSRFYEVYATLEAGAGPIPIIEKVPKAPDFTEQMTVGDTTWDVPSFDDDDDAYEETVHNLREERADTTLIVSSRVHALCDRADLKHPIQLDRDLLHESNLRDDDSPDIYCIGFASSV